MLGSAYPEGLDDSKRLSAGRRAELDTHIRQSCAWGVGIIEAEEIDRINVLMATMRAMTLAVERLVEQLGCEPEGVLIDGNLTPHGRCGEWRWDARAIVGGDGLEPAISAASIIAKEWRDRLMVEAARAHPHYGWERNKGYGTREHMELCAITGLRRSTAKVSRQLRNWCFSKARTSLNSAT